MKSINKKSASFVQSPGIYRVHKTTINSLKTENSKRRDHITTRKNKIGVHRLYYQTKSSSYVSVKQHRSLDKIVTDSENKQVTVDFNVPYSTSKKPTNIIYKARKIRKKRKNCVDVINSINSPDISYCSIIKVIISLIVNNPSIVKDMIVDFIKENVSKLFDIELLYIDTLIVYSLYDTYDDPVKYITEDRLLSRINRHIAILEDNNQPLRFPRITQNKLHERVKYLAQIGCISNGDKGIRSKEHISLNL